MNKAVFLAITYYLLLTTDYYTFRSTPYMRYIPSPHLELRKKKAIPQPPETALRGRPVRGTYIHTVVRID